MNVFVMADMEGISGIVRSSQVRRDDPDYLPARRYLTQEVNACVAGCLDGGATRITVRDAHAHGFNFIVEDLDARADYIQGHTGRARMPNIREYDGLILLGYHAMGGTPEAILEHTMSSAGWQNFWINGRRSGEIALDAAIAADHGVPTILVTGDDKACAEARRFLPGVETAVVKEAYDCEGGRLLPLPAAHERIRAAAARAVRRCHSIRPIRVRHPVTLRLELVSRGRIPLRRRGVKVLDGRTYEVTGRTVEEALNQL